MRLNVRMLILSSDLVSLPIVCTSFMAARAFRKILLSSKEKVTILAGDAKVVLQKTSDL